MDRVRRSQCALVLVAALTAACGGEQTATEPPVPTGPPVPAAIALVSGDNQSGTVGQPLGQPLVVRVAGQSLAQPQLDFNDPRKGVTVTWTVTSGGGTLSSTSTATDEQGVIVESCGLEA